MDKIQMTEQYWSDFFDDNDLDQSYSKKYFMEKLKENGYIKKSELEALVDKAEEGYRLYKQCLLSGDDLLIHLLKAIEELKSTHPEFYNKE